ncbi:hypothetical protein G3480_07405 [Thiorhodococcus mannitoliphagus]|uniref:Flagellar hook-length control protein-like C-terminal domain-containing protein n=1 Tax=Thiorhodococcus mannitoliphagus TaxID=329406 RepID=A0A6P1DSI5_9GAMM|nr:flagellar hook-length control protein FliK [Thiorhodococcus mannitoliphagus]NEX20143.1 hypothetical protein [Thiorhodococcus mannitoliphagus]
MSDSLPGVNPAQSGTFASNTARAEPTQGSQAQLLRNLRTGTQVEVLAVKALGPDVVEVRLKPAGAAQAAATTVRAQLVDAQQSQVAKLLTNAGDGGTSGKPTASASLLAEVVAVSPKLVLRPVVTANRDAPTPGSRDWIGVQLKQHWPGARPLTATLESVTNHLADPLDLARALQASDPSVRAAVQQTAERLVAQLATAQDLTQAERLSSTLSRSGIWLEAMLAQGANGPTSIADLQSDLKVQLLTLAQRLRNATQTAPNRAGHEVSPQSPRPAGPTRLALPSPPPTATTNPKLESPTLSPAGAGRPQSHGKLETTAPLPQPRAEPSQASQSSIVTAGTRTDLLNRAAGKRPQNAGAQTVKALDSAGLPRNEPPNIKLSSPDEIDLKGLARDVDGMLKHLVTSQLKTLDASQAQPHWLAEIPFKTPAGLIALETDIRRESRSGNPDEDAWSMRLNLDLPHLGPLTIKLSLRSERLSASLQAESPLAADTLKQNLAKLREQLESRDIEVAALHAGQRQQDRSEPPFDAPLISEKA